MKYNITTREGDQESVTVFIGADSLVATKDHPRFGEIAAYLTGGGDDEKALRGLFDVSLALAGHFQHLSERVTANMGAIYLDGDPLHNALTDTIVRFMADGERAISPLANFMEKIEQNPNHHSKANLFRWLEKHDFAIDNDGDFYAYKGVTSDHTSLNTGTAMVNGNVVKGKIPNQAGTIIEMPRSKVQHDPKIGCHTGLHAGNWRYAREFGTKVLLVKINPRDVVSVPTDSDDEKLRVCRYRVVKELSRELEGVLYIGREIDRLTARLRADAIEAGPIEPEKPKRQRKAKGKAKPKPKVEMEFPEYYEQYTAKHFRATSGKDLLWLLGEWEVSPKPKTKEEQVKAAAKAARKRRKDLGL